MATVSSPRTFEPAKKKNTEQPSNNRIQPIKLCYPMTGKVTCHGIAQCDGCIVLLDGFWRRDVYHQIVWVFVFVERERVGNGLFALL